MRAHAVCHNETLGIAVFSDLYVVRTLNGVIFAVNKCKLVKGDHRRGVMIAVEWNRRALAQIERSSVLQRRNRINERPTAVGTSCSLHLGGHKSVAS